MIRAAVILALYIALALVFWTLFAFVQMWFALHPIRICIGCTS